MTDEKTHKVFGKSEQRLQARPKVHDEEVKYFQVRPNLGTLREALTRKESRTVAVGEREVAYESGRSEILLSFRLMQGARCQATFLLNRANLLRLLEKDD